MGTVGYMSPEQVQGRPADHRSDIFAFGAVLYEMLSGKRAFRGASAIETLHAILKDDPPELSVRDSKVSEALSRIVRRCLEKNPDERLQSARDVGFALEAVSGASGTGPMQPLGAAPVRVPRARLGAALLAIAAAAVGGYVLAVRSHKSSIPTTRKITFRRGDLGSARFTPDGQSVVYAAAWDGKPMEIFSTRLDGPDSRPVGLPPGDVAAVSSTGKLALLVGRSAFGRGPLAGTLAEVPLGGSAPREIQGGLLFADYSADGSRLAVVRRREKDTYKLEYPAGTLLYESPNYILFPKISPSGDLIAFFEREQPDWTLAVVDLSGKRRVLSRSWIGGPEGCGLAWFPGTNQLWFSSGGALYSVVPGKREELRWRSANAIYLQDISPDGRFLISILASRRGIVCLPPGESQERDLSWFDSSVAVDLSRDGTRLLFQESSGGEAGRGTYIRKTDGSSPAVRLGEGGLEGGYVGAEELSPDGQWVLCIIPKSSSELLLIPTGAGSRKVVKLPVVGCENASWLPDNRRVIVQCHERGHGTRLYVVDLAGGSPEAITPEGVELGVISPDGLLVLGQTEDGKWILYPVDGGTPRPVPSLDGSHKPNSWSPDGRTIYLHEHRVPNMALIRFDLRTGRGEFWKELQAPDPTASVIDEVVVARDGRTYAYTYNTRVSSLYLLEGLK